MLKGEVFTVTVVHTEMTDTRREVVYDGRANTGFIVSVPAEGEYRLEARGSDGVLLEITENGETTFSVFDGETFIEPLSIVPVTPTVDSSGLSVEIIGAIVMAALIVIGIGVGLLILRMDPGISPGDVKEADLPAADDLADSLMISYEPGHVQEEEDVLEDVDE
jgi:hypothetical protein